MRSCVFLFSLFVLNAFGQNSYESSILLGSGFENLEVYDACTSLDGYSAVVAGTRLTGRKSVFIAEITPNPRLHCSWESYSNVNQMTDDFGFGVCPITEQLFLFPNAEYAVCGYSSNLNQIPTLFLFDGAGNLEASFGFGSYLYGRFKSIIQTRDGGFALLGEEISGNGEAEVFVLTIDSDLNYRWHTVTDFSVSSFTYPNCIMETPFSVGDYLVFLATKVYPPTYQTPGIVLSLDNEEGSSTEGSIIDYVNTC